MLDYINVREVQGEEIDEAANCFDNGARLQTVDDDPELRFDYWKYPQTALFRIYGIRLLNHYV